MKIKYTLFLYSNGVQLLLMRYLLCTRDVRQLRTSFRNAAGRLAKVEVLYGLSRAFMG